MVTPEKYDIRGSIQEAAIILTSCTEPKMQVTITLTSPVIREENGRDGGWDTHHILSHCTSFLVFMLSLWNQFQYVGWPLKSTVLLALHRLFFWALHQITLATCTSCIINLDFLNQKCQGNQESARSLYLINLVVVYFLQGFFFIQSDLQKYHFQYHSCLNNSKPLEFFFF